MRRLLVVLLAFGAIAAPALAAAAWNKESYLAEGLHEATGTSVAVAPNGAAVAGWQAQALLAKKHSLSLTGTVKVIDAAGNTHSFPVKTRLTAER